MPKSKSKSNNETKVYDTNQELFAAQAFGYDGEPPEHLSDKEMRRRHECAYNALFELRMAAAWNEAGDAVRAEWHSRNAIRDQKRAGLLYQGKSPVTDEERAWLLWALNEGEVTEFRTLPELARMMGLPLLERKW